MKAGRELDALIAERVMGWKVFACEPGYGRPPNKLISLVLDMIPDYSTKIQAAWLVCEKLHDASTDYRIWNRFHDALSEEVPTLWGQPATNAALIICEHALKAVGAEGKN
jgi:hypothetical protein